MKNPLLAPVAAITLLAGTSLALAQASTKEAPASGAATEHAPSSSTSSKGSPGASDVNRDQSTTTKSNDAEKKSTQSDERMQRQNRNAQESNQDKRAAPEHSKVDQSKSKNSENDRVREEGRTKAEGGSGPKGGDLKRSEGQSSQTSGQAGAGAKLSTEQRTKITSVIHEQNVRPETNVNFTVAVGTRVPNTVHFHPLPAEIVTIYPDWRGYEFFLVRDEIIVVNPRTLEIVAVLNA
ncbi:hypothetical protein BN961_00385 [Afipia felis]|uniref:DUF1236 domain-containing protein n=1 Tax=Afipia felis TaxID=1035 RepID=A0A090MMV9_AFIFE|nr:DUF1236 domain-containing protein [Afipia felis]CEG07004.1 hypothetical protein BN961_00385 [Afipia felis]